MLKTWNAVVVGGGFFGCNVALALRRENKSVLVLEQGEKLLGRASYANQARVHGGYHYPRSVMTGLRSQANYQTFLDRYRDCVDRSFAKYYAISRKFSNVTAVQFKIFCERIGAPLKPAPGAVKKLFNQDLVDEVFEVEECAFDAAKLKRKMELELKAAGIDVHYRSQVQTVRQGAAGLEVAIDSDVLTTDAVYLCVYSGLNRILHRSKLGQISLRHELTELALVDPPEQLNGMGITLMCGPFFSIMPFPARGLYSFSHVRYTPRFSWSESDELGPPREIDPVSLAVESSFLHMRKDAERFMPCLSNCRYLDSLWEIKTLLPRNEVDDARPILFTRHPQLRKLYCIIGGKIDNVFDVLSEMKDEPKQ